MWFCRVVRCCQALEISCKIQVLSHRFTVSMFKGAASFATRSISWLPETVDSVIINTALALSGQSSN